MEPLDAFYRLAGDRFEPTQLARGPWDPRAQHGGPPAALLGRAIENVEGAAGMMVARITLDILRPVPLAPLAIATTIVRPGRQVQLVTASLRVDDAEIMRATAWLLRVEEGVLDASPFPPDAPPAPPETAEIEPFFEVAADVGYHTGMEGRFVSGSFRGLGPAVVWMRMRVPLLPGEEPSPLQRVLIAADSGNGVSCVLDPRHYLFVNTELSVHLSRLPVGEWVALAATTHVEPHGVGLTRATIYDRTSALGASHQSLFVARRA